MQCWIREHHVLVAVFGTAISGVAAMTRKGEIILNYVLPDARFRGVSKALLRELELRAEQLGMKKFRSSSSVSGPPSLPSSPGSSCALMMVDRMSLLRCLRLAAIRPAA